MTLTPCLRRWTAPAICAGVVLGSAKSSLACGVSATGVASCSLAEHREAERPRFAVGAGAIATRTALRFDDTLRADQTRYAVLAELAYLPTPTLALDLGLGAALGGSLSTPEGKHEFSPGPAAAAGVAWRVVDAPLVFTLLTAQLSFVTSPTEHAGTQARYTALDLRLGGQVGLNLGGLLHPYAVGRIFGGPVYWHYQGQAVTGTDIHHYQLGLGVGVELGSRVTLAAEGVPLGEQAVSGVVSVSL